ncbi:MAG: flavodoxin family protein [bacterium]
MEEKKQKKVLGIMGSPRRGGNVDRLLEQALAGARSGGASIKKIYLTDQRITPCNGCMACRNTGQCVIRDDMDRIYPLLFEYDAFVFASPMYHQNMSCYFKTFIDRIHGVIVEYERGPGRARLPVRRFPRGKRAMLVSSMNASFPKAGKYLRNFSQGFQSFTEYAGIELIGLTVTRNTWIKRPASFDKERAQAFGMGRTLVTRETSRFRQKRYALKDSVEGLANWIINIID